MKRSALLFVGISLNLFTFKWGTQLWRLKQHKLLLSRATRVYGKVVKLCNMAKMTSLPCGSPLHEYGSLQIVHFLSGKKHKVSDYPSLSNVNRLANTQSLRERPACRNFSSPKQYWYQKLIIYCYYSPRFQLFHLIFCYMSTNETQVWSWNMIAWK